MAHCPRCSHASEHDARFCPRCGTPLEAPDAATVLSPVPAAPTAPGETHTVLATPASQRAGSGPAPPRNRSASAVTAPPASAFDSSDGHYLPGTLLANRYRIVALLGQGGMGEVYRADDLVLGQPVALKFLPRELSSDPTRLEWFRNEVRTARLVSHPNVCRVYDIGDVDGHHFLSMEYVDGEDLASLLRRIGRLPQDKGIELARQLCAGLAAAHDRGVVHRDLKPGNVMIDGRGNLRVADFGLAGVADAIDSSRGFAGTPAYMAPEQFRGSPASTRSDIYALGLVLYEMFTGKAAFAGRSVAELAELHQVSAPPSVTTVVSDLDPAVEGIIERCLEKDPQQRPPSALAVAAALPGGDPLAAALARGETPSPELVAAAGATGTMPLSRALLLVGAVVAGLVVIVALSGRTQVPGLVWLPKSPDVLRDRAAQIALGAGYAQPPADTSSGFILSDWLVERQGQPGSAAELARDAGRGFPSALWFWYRQSPDSLATANVFAQGRVSLADPPQRLSGTLQILLDPQGRLVRFVAVPNQVRKDAAPASEVDWGVLFREAGLDLARFTPTGPQWVPSTFADTRVAWQGTYPGRQDLPIRIEAAAAEGRPVYFQIVEPWTRPARMGGRPQTRAQDIMGVVLPLIFFSLIGGAAAMAIRNVRAGRGDRRGAARISLVLFAVTLLDGLLGADHEPSTGPLLVLVVVVTASALLLGGLVWIMYLALEPHVRRRWPHTLISWSRLLSGRFDDPLVGRHVLIGLAGSVLLQLVYQGNLMLSSMAATWNPASLDGTRFALSAMITTATGAVLLAMGILLLFFVLTLIVRRAWIAVPLILLFFAVNQMNAAGSTPANAVFGALAAGILLVALLRFGLLTLMVTIAATNLSDAVPLTFDLSRWYAPVSYLALGIVLLLAAQAFRAATGQRALLGAIIGERSGG